MTLSRLPTSDTRRLVLRGPTPEDYPEAAWISDRTLSLPLSAKLTDGEVSRTTDAVTGLLAR